MNIHGKKVILRALELDDMPHMREIINDPSIESMVAGWSFPISISEQNAWYETTLKDKANRRFIICPICEAKTNPIGMIYLADIDWRNRCASTGIKLSSAAPKRVGYATDAVMALLSFAFEELQMHRIGLKILATNEASIRLYEHCGAVREGILRSAVFKQGKYIDQACYGILETDFQKIKAQLEY